MSNTINTDNLIGISDFVNHTIVTDAYSPIVFAAAKFSTTSRPRISRKFIDRADKSHVNRFGQPTQISFSAALEEDVKHALCGRRDIP